MIISINNNFLLLAFSSMYMYSETVFNSMKTAPPKTYSSYLSKAEL